MIKEEYVSFETSKLLKEKGFNEPCTRIWNTKSDNPISRISGDENLYITYKDISPEVINFFYLHPTQALAYRWLREKHLLNIDISIQNGGTWNYGIEDIACPFDGGIIPKHWDDGFKTYEQALEAGIQYCLKNLIK